MLIEDENDLRAGLRALAAAPEPLGAGLAERSARRARATRHRRVAFGAVAVAAAAVAVLLAVPSPPPRASLPMARSLAAWPDHRDPEWRRAADNALAEYVDQHREMAGVPVRWLWAGDVPGTDHVAAAWAFCGESGCTRVVLSTVLRENADDRDVTGSHYWLPIAADVAPGAPQAPLAMYLSGAERPRGRTTVVLAVPPPDTTGVTWSAPALRPGTGGSGALAPLHGAFAGDIGYLSAPARLLLAGDVAFEGPVGVPGEESPQVGRARWVDPVRVAAPYQPSSSSTGQADEPLLYEDAVGSGARVTVVARCEGTAPLTIALNDKERRLTCDGVRRTVFEGEPNGHPIHVQVDSTDPYTAYSWAVGTR